MTKRQSILVDIGNERVRQELKWDQKTNDDAYSPRDWRSLILYYCDYLFYDEPKETLRKRYIQIAALAVAAVEALDRKTIT